MTRCAPAIPADDAIPPASKHNVLPHSHPHLSNPHHPPARALLPLRIHPRPGLHSPQNPLVLQLRQQRQQPQVRPRRAQHGQGDGQEHVGLGDARAARDFRDGDGAVRAPGQVAQAVGGEGGEDEGHVVRLVAVARRAPALGEDEQREFVVGRLGEDGLPDPLGEDAGGVDGGGVLEGGGRAAVVVAGFDDGVDEGRAAGVGGFEVCDEGIDGLADAGVGRQHGVYAAGGHVQAFVLSEGTGLTP